jgi:hypothetical protein
VIAAESWEVSVEMSTEDDDTYDTHTARMNSMQALLPDGRHRGLGCAVVSFRIIGEGR